MKQQIYFAKARYTDSIQAGEQVEIILSLPSPIYAATKKEAAEKARAYFASLVTERREWDGEVFVFTKDEEKFHSDFFKRLRQS